MPQQHCFVSGRSCVKNLVSLTTKLTTHLENCHQVDVVYTDSKKAFNKVSIDVLGKIFASYGVNGCLLEWLKSYLSGRQQFVRIQSSTSRLFEASSGVPQGSHLGPLAFLLLINSANDVLGDDGFLMYADDLKIILPIRSVSDLIV